MLKVVRENLKVILVATIAATIAAGAPAIAHGVRHALFAHNAGKVDGIEGRALQKRCKNGSVLAFARIRAAQCRLGGSRERRHPGCIQLRVAG